MLGWLTTYSKVYFQRHHDYPRCRRWLFPRTPFQIFNVKNNTTDLKQVPDSPGTTKAYWMSEEDNRISAARMARVHKQPPTVSVYPDLAAINWKIETLLEIDQGYSEENIHRLASLHLLRSVCVRIIDAVDCANLSVLQPGLQMRTHGSCSGLKLWLILTGPSVSPFRRSMRFPLVALRWCSSWCWSSHGSARERGGELPGSLCKM